MKNFQQNEIPSMQFSLPGSYFKVIRDGDERAFSIFSRHYSYYNYKDGRRNDPKYRHRNRFVGPGEYIALLGINNDILFVWKKFIDEGQIGINCSIFRNESLHKGSILILDAERYVLQKWGEERVYTYINPRRIRSSNPGFCYLKAGWKKCGITRARKLLILEKYLQETGM